MRHRYVTVIAATGRTLAMVEHRRMSQGHKWRRGVGCWTVIRCRSSAASPTASSPPSTQRCSEPGSCCCGAATPSPAPRPASTLHAHPRHRYVTVIVNADTGRTLAMVEHRSSAALSAFLMSQGHKWRRGVKVVVTDGSRTYKASVDACLPHARHVLDRFHVIRWFCAGLTAVRRDIQRREPHGVKPAFDPEVFRARFLLLRRGDTLTGADQARLDALFDTHPRLKAGWQALQELHGLYLANDHQGALEALGRFCDLYQTGELPEYHDTVDTFIAWSDEILAWHHTDRASNGRIEGTNNLLQVLRRTAHGFTNPANFEARGLLIT